MNIKSDAPRVCFLSASSEIWGAEQSLMTLGRHLRTLNVHPVLYSASAELVDEWRSWGCESHYLPVGKRIPVAASAFWAYRFIRHAPDKADIIVCFSLTLAPFVDALRLRTGRPRMVLDLHDYLQSQRGKRRVRMVSRRFDKVIAISNFAATQIAPNVPVSVLTRPIERDFSPASSGCAQPAIGVVGRIDPDKHLDFALAVARSMPELRFEVRGAPSDEWESYASELQQAASPNVIWVGRVPRPDVLRNLAVLFVANHREALGRVVLEAQLSEVPVVAPSSGGPAELVEDGVTGYTYSPRDAQSAMAALRRALKAPCALIDVARAHALEVSDPERYAEAYIGAIRG